VSLVSAKAGALLLLGAGGGIALLASSASWAVLSADDGLAGASAAATGAALAPLSVALGVVGLAAVPAVLALRRWLRMVVATIVLALGVATIVQVVSVALDVATSARTWWLVEVGALAQTADVTVTAWPSVALLGSGLVVVGAGLVLARGSGWRGLSSRYDAPTTAPGNARHGGATSDVDAWQALDRGDDPTEADDTRP
jgi:uncharacterized membrane protein (TIGR02234 family)